MKSWVMFLVWVICIGYVPQVHAEEIAETNQLIIINKTKNQLVFYQDGKEMAKFSVATGRDQTFTPEGDYQVSTKVKNMPYYKKNIPGGDPSNPLGKRWIGFNVPNTQGYTYGIHGTNAEWSIGSYASDGCVRMINKEVEWLYEYVKVGANVSIVKSSLSFDEIAAEKGYKLKTIEETTGTLITIDEEKIFNKPNEEWVTEASIKPGTWTYTKKVDNWFYIQQGETFGWIQTLNFTKYPLQNMEAYYEISKAVPYYDFPNELGIKKGTISPRLLNVEIGNEEWIRAKIEESNQEVWLKNEKLETLTKKQYFDKKMKIEKKEKEEIRIAKEKKQEEDEQKQKDKERQERRDSLRDFFKKILDFFKW